MFSCKYSGDPNTEPLNMGNIQILDDFSSGFWKAKAIR
jgi:hypothetical protein